MAAGFSAGFLGAAFSAAFLAAGFSAGFAGFSAGFFAAGFAACLEDCPAAGFFDAGFLAVFAPPSLFLSDSTTSACCFFRSAICFCIFAISSALSCPSLSPKSDTPGLAFYLTVNVSRICTGGTPLFTTATSIS